VRKAMEKGWEAMEKAKTEEEWDRAEIQLEKAASNLRLTLDLQFPEPGNNPHSQG